jgi:hypothetical protein
LDTTFSGEIVSYGDYASYIWTTKRNNTVLLVDENSCGACDSVWSQSKEINRFTTVIEPSENWQEPNDMPKCLPKYRNETQSSKN